jgi:hypothetical protein
MQSGEAGASKQPHRPVQHRKYRGTGLVTLKTIINNVYPNLHYQSPGRTRHERRGDGRSP